MVDGTTSSTLRAFLCVLLTASVPAGAAVFGVPPGPDPTTDPPPGYLMLVGRDTGNVAAGDDVAPFFGDPTMTGCSNDPVPVPGDPGDPCGQVFYIEVDVTRQARLVVDIYDPGLYEPDPNLRQGPQLDVSYDTDDAGAEMHYDLRDPAGVVQAQATFGPDTQGAGGTNAALFNLANINNPDPGVWTLHAWMADTGARDEEVNAFGLLVPEFRVYTYYPVVGHAAAGGAVPASHIAFGGPPIRVYPWIHGATGGVDPPIDTGTPFFGLAFLHYDFDAEPTPDPNDNPSFGEPPPTIVGITAQGAVSPDCATAPEFCFLPSVDSAYLRERRGGINESPRAGTDHGIYTFELSEMDSSWGVTEPNAPPATPPDVNAVTLQTREFMAPAPNPENTDFPAVPATTSSLFRYYLPMETAPDGRPVKEWMGISAAGPEPPEVGVPAVFTVTWEIHNPTGYDLTDLQAAIHVNDSTPDVSAPDPASLAVTGGLEAFLDDDAAATCANATGADPKRIVVCGDLPAGGDATVTFEVTVTASATGRLFLLGDGDTSAGTLGAAMAGGSRPTTADYLTPFQPGPQRESMGPLLAPHVFPTPPACSADVVLEDPGGPFCARTLDALTATPDVQNCDGDTELRWETAAGEVCLDWTVDAAVLDLTQNPTCPPPAATTTYRVRARCSTDPACESAPSEVTVDVHPEVLADAGPPSLTICPGETGVLGVDDPAAGAFTGEVAGKDSCTLGYAWDPAAGLAAGAGSCGDCADGASCPNPVAGPAATTTYTVTVTDPDTGCTAQDAIEVRVAGDAPPAHVGCSLRVASEVSGGDVALGLTWTDSADPSGDYEIVAFEPDAGTSPCPESPAAAGAPDLAAMEGASVLGTVAPGTEAFSWDQGRTACPRLLFFKVRPTRPCSGTPVAFTAPNCN